MKDIRHKRVSCLLSVAVIDTRTKSNLEGGVFCLTPPVYTEGGQGRNKRLEPGGGGQNPKQRLLKNAAY